MAGFAAPATERLRVTQVVNEGTQQVVVRGRVSVPDLKPDVEMTLAGDVAHQFWLKQITLPVALARKLITAKGALNKVMKMLPLLKPLHEAYPDLCARYGLPR
mgnify:CR=1 FL=1